MENIGKRLKSLREKYKFSLEEVAQKIKSSAGAISRYENNERKINSESLIRLSNLYNVSPEYILYGINKDSSNLESSIISFFNNENIDFKEKEELFNKIQNAFFKEKFSPHKSLPFIERYEMRWKNPWSVEVIIYEKNMVGYVRYMSSNFYFDGDGVVVESTKKKAPGIPEVKGLKFSSVSLYKALPVENKGVFQDILNLSASLQQEKISCDYIEYSGTQAIIHVGDIRVLLGGNEDMEQKVMSLKDILPALSGRKGTLDLSEFKGRKEKEAYIFRENK